MTSYIIRANRPTHHTVRSAATSMQRMALFHRCIFVFMQKVKLTRCTMSGTFDHRLGIDTFICLAIVVRDMTE